MFKNFNLFVAAPKTGDIPDMQFYYDKCLPGNSTLLNNYDAVTMKLTDISLNVKDCILDMSKSVASPKDVKPTLIPMVRTAAEMPRQTGLLENLVTIGVVDIENTASLVVDKFFDSYLLKEKRKPNKNF